MMPSSKLNILKNASTATIFRGLGVLSGFALDATVLYHFGVGKETDSFFAALALPLIITMTLENQVPKVLIPFISKLKADNENLLSSILNSFFTLSIILLLSIVLVLILFSRLLIYIQIPGLGPDTINLAKLLSVHLSFIVLLRGISTIFQSILFTEGIFGLSTAQKFVYSIITIATLILLKSQFNIFALAYGFIFSSLLHLIVLYIACFRLGYRLRISKDISNSHALEALSLLKYPVSGHFTGELKVLFENFFLSFLGTGSISMLRYASRMASSISGVLFSSIVTASIPMISHLVSNNLLDELKKSLIYSIKFLLIIATPICLLLIFTGDRLITILYERGDFTSSDSAVIGVILSLMTPYILFSRIVGILQVPFYACFDAKTPFYSSLIILAVNLILIGILSNSLGIYTFPVSSSVATISGFIFLFLKFKKVFGPFNLKDMNSFLKRIGICTSVSIILFNFGLHSSSFPFTPEILQKYVLFIIPNFLGFSSFFLCAFIFKIFKWRTFNKS